MRLQSVGMLSFFHRRVCVCVCVCLDVCVCVCVVLHYQGSKVLAGISERL